MTIKSIRSTPRTGHRQRCSSQHEGGSKRATRAWRDKRHDAGPRYRPFPREASPQEAMDVAEVIAEAGGRCSEARLHDLLAEREWRSRNQRERAIELAKQLKLVEIHGQQLQLTR